MKHQLHERDFQVRHTRHKQDFQRCRVLGFAHIATMLINRMVKSMATEVLGFPDAVSPTAICTKQAFSKARKKLRYTAFVELNTSYVELFYRKHPYATYGGKSRLAAVDGSIVQLPQCEGLSAHFGQKGNDTGKGMSSGRASVVYDVLNQVAVNALLSGLGESGTDQFRRQYEAMPTPCTEGEKWLYLMDRGYPSHDLCKMMDIRGDGFVIRCPRNFCRALEGFVGSGQRESKLMLKPTVWYSKKGGKRGSRFPEPLEVRAVRIELGEGREEYLITNTGESSGQLKYLYGLRWGVETYYGYLKDEMELENFSSKKPEGILQDFHACILASNLVNMLVQEAQRELERETKRGKDNKYRYKINRKVATGILRGEVVRMLFLEKDIPTRLEKLKNMIKQQKTAVVPDREYPRHKLKRSRRKFHLPKKKVL